MGHITFEDEQEFLILKIVYGKGRLSTSDFKNISSDIIGDSFGHTVTKMIENGLIERNNITIRDETTGEFKSGHTVDMYEITKLGKNKFISLKKSKKNRNIRTIAFWILFAASFLAGLDVVIKWSSKEKKSSFKNESPQLSLPDLSQIDTNQAQTVKPDTTAFQKIHLADSLIKKKNTTQSK